MQRRLWIWRRALLNGINFLVAIADSHFIEVHTAGRGELPAAVQAEFEVVRIIVPHIDAENLVFG